MNLSEKQQEIVNRMSRGLVLEYNPRSKRAQLVLLSAIMRVARADFLELKNLKLIDLSTSKGFDYYRITELGRIAAKGAG